jgi:hypothetical protein
VCARSEVDRLAPSLRRRGGDRAGDGHGREESGAPAPSPFAWFHGATPRPFGQASDAMLVAVRYRMNSFSNS